MVDTRPLFRPLSEEFVSVLRGLSDDQFGRPTIAGRWVVRDVLAHLVDLTFRRLSFHRDRMAPPPPAKPIASERDFIEFINGINAEWIDATRRLSPRALVDLYALGSRDLADWFESLPLDAPALFGVSWAGEMTSEGWFDVGREFLEIWHHQQQIRMAVGAPLASDPRFLGAVLAIGMRGVPHAFRHQSATPDRPVVIEITGKAPSSWTLRRDGDRWTLDTGAAESPAARIRVRDEDAWQILCNSLKGEAASAAVTIEGDRALAAPFLTARAVIV